MKFTILLVIILTFVYRTYREAAEKSTAAKRGMQPDDARPEDVEPHRHEPAAAPEPVVAAPAAADTKQSVLMQSSATGAAAAQTVACTKASAPARQQAKEVLVEVEGADSQYQFDIRAAVIASEILNRRDY